MWLFNKDVPVKPQWVQLIGLGFVAWLLYSGWGVGFYTTGLLICYTLMVIYVIHYYRFRPGFQPVCLAFLICFLNSIYWEFPLHVADFLEFDNFGVLAVQCLHLLPVPFLVQVSFRFPRRWWYWSIAMWVVVAALAYARMMFGLPQPFGAASLYFSRILGLYTLLWVLRFPGQEEDKIILRVRGVLNV
jgi:hypothetical protein